MEHTTDLSFFLCFRYIGLYPECIILMCRSRLYLRGNDNGHSLHGNPGSSSTYRIGLGPSKGFRISTCSKGIFTIDREAIICSGGEVYELLTAIDMLALSPNELRLGCYVFLNIGF